MKNDNALARSFLSKMCTAFSEEELAALLLPDVYAQVKDYLFENFAEILKRSPAHLPWGKFIISTGLKKTGGAL